MEVTEVSPSDEWDTDEPDRVGDVPVEAPPKWVVVAMISEYHGPNTFVAQRDDQHHPYLFRWAGGTESDRLFESDCHKGMKQPYYVKQSELDLGVDTSPTV